MCLRVVMINFQSLLLECTLYQFLRSKRPILNDILLLILRNFLFLIQSDQKVSVHLMISVQSSVSQRLFDHPALDPVHQNSDMKVITFRCLILCNADYIKVCPV